MKKLLTVLIFILCICACSKAPTQKEITGAFCTITTTNLSIASIKDASIMGCCGEWNAVYNYAEKLTNICMMEAYQYHLYDNTDKLISQELPLHMKITPTEDFINACNTTEECSFAVYFLGVDEPIEATFEEDSFIFDTPYQGIFLLSIIKDGSTLLINNPECDGRCSDCSN